jgi:2-polyprenyl-3-methyl-5-hydroxy-6-metoxy-1,4-benzoquinol methylase
METVSCNLCGSNDYRELYRMPDVAVCLDEWFTVVECCHCGLGFVNPRPTFEEMTRYYPSRYYDGFRHEQEYHHRRYSIEARFVERFHRPSRQGKLLDVGCANGDFPRFMRGRGWDVEGVEVSSTSNPITDLPVYQQTFPDIPVSDPTYDAVTAWAVLEHVHDPAAYFRKASQVLLPGGIFVFNIPNFGSLASRYLFREDIPRHLYFFTERNVRQYLSRNDMTLVEARFDDSIYSMLPNNWLHYYLRFKLPGRKFQFADSLFSRQTYFKSHNLQPGFKNSVGFFMSNPHIPVDRALRRAVERYQMLAKTYGVGLYAAVKR